MTRAWIVLSLIVLACTSLLANDDLRLARIFSDNAVFQRERPVPVWGWAAPREKVKVNFSGQEKTTEANADGYWIVRLDAMKANAEPANLTVTGKAKTLTLKNILIGEVWICSGNSFMGNTMGLGGYADYYKDIVAKADHPLIRYYNVEFDYANQPRKDLSLVSMRRWVVCTPQAAGSFASLPYEFALELQRLLKVPVGLIVNGKGGSAGISGQSEEVAKTNPLYEREKKRQQSHLDEDTAKHGKDRLKEFEEKKAKWEQEAEAAFAAGKPLPRQDWNPYCDVLHFDVYNRAGALYNAVWYPLAPYAVRGDIWHSHHIPIETFHAMVQNWEKIWGQEFVVIVAADKQAVQKEGVAPKIQDEPIAFDSEVALKREQKMQYMGRDWPRIGTVVLADGGGENLHNLDKKPEAHRMAMMAMKLAYGQDVVYSGPIYKSMTVDGNKVRLKFDCVGGGLVLKLKEGVKETGFAIAEKEGTDWRWANVKIDGSDLVVWCDTINKPAAVRYAWHPVPIMSLWNKEGLPAAPFRTDTWPIGNMESKERVKRPAAAPSE